MKTREELLKEMNRFRRQMLTPEQSKILKQGLHDILNAPTQAQLDCPYCHGTDNLNDTTNRNNDFQIKIDLYGPDDARLNVEYRGGADREIAHINYCPVCGYRLKGRANDD